MDINEKRKEIDAIDLSIVELLERRALLSREIAVIKMSAGLPIEDRTRENDVIRRISTFAGDRTVTGSLRRIYRRILHESRDIQSKAQSDLARTGVIS